MNLTTKDFSMKRLSQISILALSIALLAGCADSQTSSNQTSSKHNRAINTNDYLSVVPSGKIVKSSFDSQQLYIKKADKQPWQYAVYLPPNFSNSKTYPVIYMLHGGSGNFTDWLDKGHIQPKLDRLIALKALPESIVVFPDAFNSYYIDGDKTRLQSAFINELIPEIERNYPIKSEREYHAIGGLSMGGFGASRYALSYPDYFSSALMLSPAVWTVESMPQDRRASFEKDRSDVYGNPFDDERLRAHQYDQIKLKDNKKWPVSFYVAYGSADTVTSPHDAEAFIEWAKKQHFSVESHKYNAYGHSWDFWTASVDDGLKFIGEQFNQVNFNNTDTASIK